MLLWLPPLPVDDAAKTLDRFASFMRRSSSVAADLRLRSNMVPGEGKGRLILVRPNRVFFAITWNPNSYVFTQNESRIVEADRITKRYMQFGPAPQWVQPPAEINTLGGWTFPEALVDGDLRKFTGSAAVFQLVKPTPGVRVQTVSSTFDVENGKASLTARIDEIGRPLYLKFSRPSALGRFDMETYFSNWIVDRSYPPATFSGDLSKGYVADALPFEGWPIELGSNFPMGGWSTARETGTATIPGQRQGQTKYLVAIVGENCPPSQGLLDFLKRNRNAIESKRIGIVLIHADGKPAGIAVFPGVFDPTRKLLRKIGMPGTPAMYLLEKNGIALKCWYAYDRRQDRTYLAEILDSGK